MHVPTLGYEDDVVISKMDIGKVQIESAIELFIKGNYICATTLAGAAEDVFSGILNSRGLLSVVDISLRQIDTVRNVSDLNVKEIPPKKEFVKIWNYSRNSLKHHNNYEEEILKTNLFDGAYWMIKRAMYNSSQLGVVLDNQSNFENWCMENIHF